MSIITDAAGKAAEKLWAKSKTPRPEISAIITAEYERAIGEYLRERIGINTAVWRMAELESCRHNVTGALLEDKKVHSDLLGVEYVDKPDTSKEKP